MKGIFKKIALEFNNEAIIICLPTKAEDIKSIEEEDLDANDNTRIRIKRDGKWCEKVYCTVLVEYEVMLYTWYKVQTFVFYEVGLSIFLNLANHSYFLAKATMQRNKSKE